MYGCLLATASDNGTWLVVSDGRLFVVLEGVSWVLRIALVDEAQNCT